MEKIYKILGKRGRITIPFELRRDMGFAYNDVVSFEQNGDTVTVKREKVCDKCKVTAEPKDRTVSLLELLDELSPAELRAALVHLSVRWANLTEKGLYNGGDGDAGV
jgi:bifunctional DNA-binding transcriptional regulator/antitoxin component of YhaV-PrlF toxin-antitoxin module